MTSFIYALGRIEPRFPSLALAKKLAQVVGRGDTKELTDRQMFHSILSKGDLPQGRYLMNNPKMPAFTAEASVYRTKNHYHLTVGRSLMSGGVLQQLQRNPSKDLINQLFSDPNPIAAAVAAIAASMSGGTVNTSGQVDWGLYNACAAGCAALTKACREGCRVAELDNCDYCARFAENCLHRCWTQAQ